MSEPETQGINTFSEHGLHSALKTWYAQPGDRFEAEVAGYVIDLVRDDLLIEIQTGNFAGMKSKLIKLLPTHRLRLVYPVPALRWIVKLDQSGRQLSRRRSPKKGQFTHLFRQLVYLYPFTADPHFSLEVLLTHDEEIRCNDGQGSWRRKGWSIRDRRLLDVVAAQRFDSPADYLMLLPADLPEQFTTADLAVALKQPRPLARQMAYCLREMGLLTSTGKRGNAYIYTIA